MIVLGGILVVVWGTIGVVVYRTFFAKPAPPPTVSSVLPTDTGGTAPGATATLPAAEFDRSVLKDSRLTSLKVFGEVPLEVRVRGKQNPFEPYEP
jgi:hypothetical protein